MDINGKTPLQLLKEMPWQQQVIVVVGGLFLLFTILYLPLSAMRLLSARTENPGPLSLPKMKDITGALDPSMTAVGKNTVMAFTVVKKQEPANATPLATEVRLAQTTGDCDKWEMRPGGFQSRAEEIVGPDGTTPVKAGIWRAETPSLIYDPADKGHEWKLYAYRYFWANDIPLARLYGMIVYASSTGDATKWTTEEWLFSATADAPPPPYGGMVKAHLNKLDPSLADIYFYSRPSAIMAGTDILMTLSAYTKGSTSVDRIVLIGSNDHGKSWQYLGTPLRRAELARMGDYNNLGGATLLEHKGAIYLAAVLGNDKIEGQGTFVMPFENLGKGILKHDAKTGAPIVLKHIKRTSVSPTQTGGGFSAYSDSCPFGVVTSEYSGLTKDFALFKTLQPPVE